MGDLIYVKSGPKNEKGRVALWDTHPSHPHTTEFPDGEELFVAGDGKPKLAARTPNVNKAIHDGILVEVSGEDVSKWDNDNKRENDKGEKVSMMHKPINPDTGGVVPISKAVSPADTAPTTNKGTGEPPTGSYAETNTTDSSADVATGTTAK